MPAPEVGRSLAERGAKSRGIFHHLLGQLSDGAECISFCSDVVFWQMTAKVMEVTANVQASQQVSFDKAQECAVMPLGSKTCHIHT